ncbi:MAG: hypothetical protein RI906_206 [Pseudomonadota bacterium]|jgi:uncharacterized flavoprotein (TIGR03862 family)
MNRLDDTEVLIVGGGPAGLMAAETILKTGYRVSLVDAMASVGRKFLLAGRGGLNLTHAEPDALFRSRYGPRSQTIASLLDRFDAQAMRAWAHDLGEPTFIGSSQRVFPVSMKAAPLLRAWLARLRGLGLRIHVRHRLVDWEADGVFRLAAARDQPLIRVRPVACVLALGGASWPQLGSDGRWVALLRGRGIPVTDLRPANCGFDRQGGWSLFLRERFAGQPVKPVALRVETPYGAVFSQQGEFVLTDTGIEGSLVYAASALIRDTLEAQGSARVWLDLLPGQSQERIADKLARARGSRSLSNHLRAALSLSPLKIALLHECLSRDQLQSPEVLASALKALPLTMSAARPVAEAISTAGGVPFEALDDSLMLRTSPGVFCAGEMLDWEAPTGGYLLTACMASGRVAGLGVVHWLKRLNHPEYEHLPRLA